MSDKVRGGLFNILGDITGLSVLDAFSGSGALAFEAASRGGLEVIAIESDRAAQTVIQKNILTLHVEDTVKLIKASASAWLQTSPNIKFDIVLCDPPYNDLQPSLILQLSERVSEEGIFVVSWPPHIELPDFNMNLQKQRSYGDAQLFFFVR